MSELKQLRGAASLFSTSVLRKLVSDGESGFISLLNNLGLTVNSANPSLVFQQVYSVLLENYRSEYVYKNAIAEKLIRGRHKFSKNCYFSTEFRVGNSLADVVVANGTTTVYEIKTEFDSFERLESQLNDYEKVFDQIHVVLPEKKVVDWSKKVPEKFGVTVLSDNYTLREYRSARSNISNIDLSVLFSCFRREEFINVIQRQFGFVPKCRPVELKAECKALFLKLDNDAAHKEFLLALKSRQPRLEKIDLLKVAPPSLTSALLSANLTVREMNTLNGVFREAN